MSVKFKFRKFISPDSYAACGISGVSDNAAFTTSTEYATYNELTESGSLVAMWNNAIVLSAPTTKEETQEYFTREWVEDDGVDVYLKGAKKRKAVKNELDLLIYTSERKANQSFNTIINKLNEWGVFEYYDTYYKGLKRLTYEGFEIILERTRDGNKVIHFKITCTNILGYDNKNFNPSTGGTIW